MKVVARERVALRAMRLTGILRSVVVASQSIDLRGHHLKVFRVAAGSVATKVIKLVIAGWHKAVQHPKGDPVSVDNGLAVDSEVTIAGGRQHGQPWPAFLVTSDCDLVPEALSGLQLYLGKRFALNHGTTI